jgi:chromosome segregation ATPase
MNRRLQIFNLLGVAVLTVICLLQWKRDRALNLELNRSERTRLEQQSKLAEQEKNLRGLTDDLALFKEQLSRTQNDGRESAKRLKVIERENQLLTSARDQLQESVTNWANAVTARDKLIAEANDNIRALNERAGTLAGQLNASIQKFNELATNYNTVVEELNAARRAKSAGPTNTAAR